MNECLIEARLKQNMKFDHSFKHDNVINKKNKYVSFVDRNEEKRLISTTPKKGLLGVASLTGQEF